MNRNLNPEHEQEVLPEYDFADGTRGKHHEDYKAGTNVILLEPDLAKAFPDSVSVRNR